MKNFRFFKFLTLVFVLLCGWTIPADAHTTNDYGKVNVSTTGTGAGTVYISENQKAKSGVSSYSWNCNGKGDGDSKTLYLYATSTDKNKYVFKGWMLNDNLIENSNQFPYTITAKAASTSSSAPTTFNYVAKFNEIKNFQATINASGLPIAGGTAIVSNNGTQSVISSDDEKTFTFTLTATPNSDYVFEGWSHFANGSNIISTDNPYNVDVKCTQANPTNSQNWYAVFKKHTYYSKMSAALASGKGGVLVAKISGGKDFALTSSATHNSVSTTGSASHKYYISANSSRGYTFDGWYADKACTTLISKEQSTQSTVTATSEDGNSPTEVLWYAKFMPQISYSANVEVAPYNNIGGTVSSSVVGSATATTTATTKDFTFNLTATADEGYRFDGWMKEGETQVRSNSNVSPYQVKVTCQSGNPTVTEKWYAKFTRVYDYTATVKVVGDGGTATVSNNGTQSATTADVSKTFTFTLTATADETNGYTFKGWSRTVGGAIEKEGNPLTLSVTCTANQPTVEETWYAICDKPEQSTVTTYTNPLIADDVRDPSVVLAGDGYYYMVSSETVSGKGFPIWRSADMISWDIVNYFKPSKNNHNWSKYLSPELCYISGNNGNKKYVIFYTLAANEPEKNGDSDNGSQICVATSKNPYGPFSNETVLLTSSKNTADGNNCKTTSYCHNPSLFRDIDGNNYLLWGAFNGVYYIQLDNTCTALASGSNTSVNSIVSKSNLKTASLDYYKIKAPVLFRHDHNGTNYYYLLASRYTGSKVNNATEYELVAARGTKLGGKFVDQDGRDCFTYEAKLGNQGQMLSILKTNSYVASPAHNSQVLTDKKAVDWIFYHGYSKKNDNNNGNNWDTNNKKLFADKLLWENEWGLNGWPCLMPPTKEAEIEEPEVDHETQVQSAMDISTAEELLQFAALVNDAENGNTLLNGKLLNDIDCAGIEWTPIGTDDKPYKGVLNGQNHKITNLTASGSNKVALIGVAGSGANVKNLTMDASCSFTSTASGSYAAAFMAYVKDAYGSVRFENCGNEASVSGANAAGFVAGGASQTVNKTTTSATTEFVVCYNTGTIKGTTAGAAFSAKATGASYVVNSWNSGSLSKTTNGKTLARETTLTNTNSFDLANSPKPSGYAAEWFTNGHFTYYMNEANKNVLIWYQKIGVDAHPYPFTRGGDVVYKGVLCDKTTAIYTNTQVGYDHDYDHFELTSTDLRKTCKNCKDCAMFVPRNGDYLEVSSADQLEMIADYLANYDLTVNVKLMNDIDFRVKGTKMLGSANHPFTTIFDGQLKHVTLNYNASAENCGLFGYLGNAGTDKSTCVVRNLYVDGTITNANGSNYFGSIFGSAQNATVEKCLSTVAYTDAKTTNHTGNFGGIGGTASNVVIDNCAFVGSVKASNASKVSGILGNGSKPLTISNSYVAAAMNRGGGSEYTSVSGFSSINNYFFDTVNDLAVTGGKLCYDLNEGQTPMVWFQTIATQKYPIFEGDEVSGYDEDDYQYYRQEMVCDRHYTICLPYGSKEFEGATVYKLVGKIMNEAGDGVASLYLEEVSKMEAGVPYVIKAISDELVVKYCGEEAKEPGHYLGMYGKYERFAFKDWSDYQTHANNGGVYVMVNGVLKKGSQNSGVNANCAFFIMDEVPQHVGAIKEVKASRVDLNELMWQEEETDVQVAEADADKREDAAYNLQGQRVANPRNGIYIINGRKIFKK